MEKPWELYWQDTMTTNSFLRSERQVHHPSRYVIAEKASKYSTVLECGCATAIDYPYHEALGTEYTGIDVTPRFKELAEEYNPGIHVETMNAMDLKFPDGSYGTVYEKAVFEHMHYLDWPVALREMWRVAEHQVILAFFRFKPGRHHGKHATPKKKRPITQSIYQLDLEEVLNELGAEYSYEVTERARGVKEYTICTVVKPGS